MKKQERQFKFRAWFVAGDNNEIKAMIEGITLYDSGDLGMCDDDFRDIIEEQTGFKCEDYDVYSKDGIEIDLTEFNCYNGEDWMHFEGHVMQFTGLKDKNGVGIYENDIVRYSVTYGEENETPEGSYTETFIEEVTFVDGQFCVDGYAPVNCFPCEVIGNSFQNPELLVSNKGNQIKEL